MPPSTPDLRSQDLPTDALPVPSGEPSELDAELVGIFEGKAGAEEMVQDQRAVAAALARELLAIQNDEVS